MLVRVAADGRPVSEVGGGDEGSEEYGEFMAGKNCAKNENDQG